MSDVLKALSLIDKLLPEAKQQLKQMSPNYKVPTGIFEGKIKKFELGVNKGRPVLNCVWNVVKHSDYNYNDSEVSKLMFLNSAFGVAKAMEMFTLLGVTNAVKKGKDFQNLVNASNKVKDLFAVDLSYTKDKSDETKEYIELRIVRKLEEPMPVVEESAETETEEIVEEEPVIDDFKDDDEPMYEEIPELDEPKNDQYEAQLRAFCSVVLDMKRSETKDLSSEEAIKLIKQGDFDVNQLDTSEKELLKNVGII